MVSGKLHFTIFLLSGQSLYSRRILLVGAGVFGGRDDANHGQEDENDLLTCAEVDAVQQTAHPGHLADSLAEIVDKLRHEDTEAVGDAVHDHVTDEGGGHDDPAVAAVRGCRNLGKFQFTHVHIGDTVSCGNERGG